MSEFPLGVNNPFKFASVTDKPSISALNKRPYQFSRGRRSAKYVPETESTSFLVVKRRQLQHLVDLSVDLVPQEKRENFHD